MIIDKGGFLITHRGEAEQFDLTTIAALASGAYLANQTIANLVHEENFDSVYQQGEKFSMFVLNVDEYVLLVLIFRATISVGAVKYFALRASPRIAGQLKPPRTRPRRRPGPLRPQRGRHQRILPPKIRLSRPRYGVQVQPVPLVWCPRFSVSPSADCFKFCTPNSAFRTYSGLTRFD